MVLLLGVLPRRYLHQMVMRSSTHYLNRFYNSNFSIPSLSAHKVRKYNRQKLAYTLNSGVHSMYSMFLGSVLTA